MILKSCLSFNWEEIEFRSSNTNLQPWAKAPLQKKLKLTNLTPKK